MTTSVHGSLPQLCAVPGGPFRMGDDGGRKDERPAHDVVIRPVLVARTPVTNAEYRRFLLATGRDAPPLWQDGRFNQPDQPVVAVNWYDAGAYCSWLSEQSNRLVRLPTEAEWECAARGGHAGQTFPWGEDPQGWCADLAEKGTRQEQPNPVGRSRPNGYGLLDMGYNVHEWCSDWYAADYYPHSPRFDPRGPATGTRRASRGGAWRHQVQVCRNAARSSLDPTFCYNDYGFRIVCEA